MFFVTLVKSEIKIENNVNYVKKVLQNVHKYPQNSVIELIHYFTNAFCEIWCFKNGFDKIGLKNYYGAPPPPEFGRAISADDSSKLVFRPFVLQNGCKYTQC